MSDVVENASKPRPRIEWGAKAIGRTINRTERQTYHLLENGYLPGAFKAGDQHALNVDVFLASTGQPQRKSEPEAIPE